MEKVLVLLATGFFFFPVIQSLENHIKTWQFGKDYPSNTLIRTIKGKVPPSMPTNIYLDLPRCFTPTYVTLTLTHADSTSTVFYNNGSSSLYVFCSVKLYCKFRVVVKGIENSWRKCKDHKSSPKTCETPDCRVGRSNEDHEEVVCLPVTKLCSTPDCQKPPTKSPNVEKPCVGLNCQPKIPDMATLESILKSAPIPSTYANKKSNNVLCTKSSCRTFAPDRSFVPIIKYLASHPATKLLSAKPLNNVKPILNYLTLNADKPNRINNIKRDTLIDELLSDNKDPPKKCTIRWQPQVHCDPSRAGGVQQRISKKPCLSPDCASELAQINQENPVDLTRYIAQSVEHDYEDSDTLMEKHFKSDNYRIPDNYKHQGLPDMFDEYNFSDDYINNLAVINKNVDGENRRGGHDDKNYHKEETPIVGTNLPLLNTKDI